jgi:hypothetical protein
MFLWRPSSLLSSFAVNISFSMPGNVESATDIRSFRIGFLKIVAKPATRMLVLCHLQWQEPAEQHSLGRVPMLLAHNVLPTKTVD